MFNRFFWLILFLSFFKSDFIGQNQKEIYPSSYFWNKNEAAQFFGDSPYGIGADVIHRRGSVLNNGNPFERHLRTSIRPWFHMQFGPDARLSLSPLGYFTTNEYIAIPEDFGRASSYELRSTIQFFHHHKQMMGKIMHTWRYRLEFRNRLTDGAEEFTNFMRFRFRYRFRYIINAPDFYTQGMWYTNVSLELGLNMGSPVVFNTFNQSRLYVGVGRRIFNSARVELRYVDRFRSRSSGFEMDRGRGLMLAINIDQASILGRKYTQPVRYAD
jgi:hypothetical protein